MLRQCSKCREFKLEDSFSKCSRNKDGLAYRCKQCDASYYNPDIKLQYAKEYRIKHIDNINKKQSLYRKNFPEKHVLSMIKQRCENINNKRYNCYGGRGIKCLITAEEIKFLMERDGYWNMKNPSIDRIDNDGDYTFENCQFLEFNINSGKDKAIKVYQYDLQGNFLKEWSSAQEIRRTIGISDKQIQRHIKGGAKTCHGFIWKYKKLAKEEILDYLKNYNWKK
jgi:hypothetical protein